MCYAHITGIHAGTVIGNGYLTFDGKWYNNRGMKISYPTPALLILRVLIFLYTLLILETRRVPIDNFDDSTPNDNSRLFKCILKYIMFKFKILFNKTWNLVRVWRMHIFYTIKNLKIFNLSYQKYTYTRVIIIIEMNNVNTCERSI